MTAGLKADATGHVTGDTKTRSVNKLKLGVAQKRAAQSGVLYDHALADVVLLIEELDRSQRGEVVDSGLVDEIRKKYGQTVLKTDPTL